MSAATAEPILVPREHVNDDSVFVTEWIAADGARVEAGAVVCTIETSKAIVEIEAPIAGFVRRRAQLGDEVPIGGVLGYVTATADAVLPDAEPARGDSVEPGLISAKARRKMEDLGLDPTLFAGRANVREKDVIEMASRRAAGSVPDDPRGPSRVEALSPVQRRTARVMEQSIASIPASYLERTIDLGTIRARAKTIAETSKGVVTELDLVVCAVARACLRHPHFNAHVTERYELQVFEQVNVGVAMDLEGELYVPVLKNAATKEPAAIAKELRSLLYLTQRRRLEATHLSGGTITVTSMVGRGVQRFLPIPYPQQAAIIGLADPERGTGERTALSIVFDHRVANGSAAASFLATVEELAIGA
ncbi:MAG: 2-oxo acid dehydrogenase subunit E2 [Deltaproteobacteria bacterium]|nr:2-oxo acid dehydrogenase subunit E2 [Deltaproteobacteria bacterium]